MNFPFFVLFLGLFAFYTILGDFCCVYFLQTHVYFKNTQKSLESWVLLLMIWKVFELVLLFPFYVLGSSLLGCTKEKCSH